MTSSKHRAIRSDVPATVSLPERKSEFAALMQAAIAGAYKPAYLLIGEPFETKPAAQALVETLVPASKRAFNLETYDGRTTSVAAIIDSLRTPGFFPGVKVVWVRESTAFLSGEKRSDIAAGLFRAWAEGRENDAIEKLLTLLALAGWSDEQFRETRCSALPKTRVRELLGGDADGEQLAQLDAAQAACIGRDLRVSAYRDDSGALLALLETGMPPQTVLIFTAAAVDARKRLVKQLREIGAVVDLSSQRERSGALTRDTVDASVRQVVSEHQKRLAAPAHELILRRAGSDFALLSMELEKLCLYVGERAVITEDDVRAAFRDMAESWIFDFTAALASRQLARALPLLRGLMEQAEPPLRLLAMVTREVRLLLIARECLDEALRGAWRSEVSFNVFQSRLLPQVDAQTRQAFGNVHPFVLYRRFQDAARVPCRHLRQALLRLSALDVQLKSSRSDPAILLEAFVIDWCRSGVVSQRRARAA